MIKAGATQALGPRGEVKSAAAAAPLASTASQPLTDPLKAAAKATTSATTTATTSSAPAAPASATSTTTGMPAVTPGTTSGGGATGGGATAGGGGTTSGGATTGGGATTAGAASTSAKALGIPGLSINSNPTDLAAGGNSSGGGATLRGPAPPSTAIVCLKDVANVELGAQNYNQTATFDGQPSAGLAVFLLPGVNALDVAKLVRARMEELKRNFPEDVDYAIAYDTTPFIGESIADVVHTLFEAVILVGLVVMVFLQSWRAVLIPMIAVPVAIVGTFAVMAAVGFSLNNISLFGLVLAIGIVVDDAIVVVENVERWLEKGLAPRDAARQAMDEVTGPVIAVALVLCAVFVPCAFISGITGRFFRQFAVTIAVSTVFSAINSLTLSPALAAILLRPKHEGALEPRRVSLKSLVLLPVSLLQWTLRWFDRGFAAATTGYGWAVGKLVAGRFVVLASYGGLLVVTYGVFARAPSGFVPQQDQGRIFAAIQLPDSAALWRTQETVALAEDIARKTPGVAHTLGVSGNSFVQQASGSNFGTIFIVLDPFDQRRTPDRTADAIMARIRQECNRQIKDGGVAIFSAPPVPGLSVAGGFKLMVEDRGGLGIENLQQQTNALIAKLQKESGLAGVSTPFRSNVPQLFMDIDRSKVASLGVSFDELNQTLAIYVGSLYVTSFNQFGRLWQVTLQADQTFRSRLESLNLIHVRNNRGQMAPLSTLVNVREVGGPIFVVRYNLYTAAPITGGLMPGASTGDAIAGIENLAKQALPRSMGTEWTELFFLQVREGNTAVYVFALAVLCVFLALAALYESWSLPLAVILVVPLCLLCAIGGVLVMRLSVDIFVQIGLVVLVGLACKNAILIVEFARELRLQGLERSEATVEASRLRLRPILMTSFAFILGVFPLVIATGAGAEMRWSLGTAVFASMFGVTLFGIFLTPVFFYVIQGASELRLFAALSTRWFGSGLLGGVCAAAAGILLGLLGVAPLPWAPVIGACAGSLLALGAVAIHGKIQGARRSARPSSLAPPPKEAAP